MSFFVAKLQNEEVVAEFFSDTLKRGEQAMLNVNAQLIKKKDSVFWINVTETKVPPIYYLFFIFLACFLIWGGWAWFIPMTFFGTSYLFFWRGFHVWAFKKGLRKKGYTGEIIILSIEQGILEAFFR
ncbi:MAG: hypothetical protein ACP5N3_04155 [Candidatus Nanoarchaeia archaeon]